MAVSITLSDLKIDVTATGGVEATLEEVYQAVIALDAARMTRTGAGSEVDPYLYNIPPKAGQVYCELEISSGCDVLFQNSGTNYSSLSWTWGVTSAAPYIFDPAAGSHISAEPGFIFDFDLAGTHYGYIQMRGSCDIIGTLGNEVIFKHYRNFYVIPYRDASNFDYVKFIDVTYSSAYQMYIYYQQAADPVSISMKHITVSNTGTQRGRMYLQNMNMPFSNYIFEDWHIENLIYGGYYTGGNFYLKRFYYKDTGVQILGYAGGTGVGIPIVTEKAEGNNLETFQPMNVYEDCTWDNTDAGTYAGYGYYPGRMLLINPTFINVNYGFNATYGHIIAWQGTITMPSGTPKVWGTNGAHVWVRNLSITVKDEDGNPIEGAVVSLIQSEGKEYYSGLTSADGKLLSVHGRDPVIIEKEETSAGNFTNWSDSIAGGRYLSVVVAAKGYNAQTNPYEMTEDKDITINLITQNEQATVINGSTIYDSVIY